MTDRAALTELACPHPSAFIQDELDARGWTLADLANRMGPECCVRNKMSLDMYFLIGPTDTRMRIGHDTAERLSRAFDISAQFFLNLEAAWLRSALSAPTVEEDSNG